MALLKLSHAQVLPDSIQRRFENVKRDSNFVVQLNSLATNYLKTSPATSRRIATYSIELSSDLKFTRGYARALTVLGNSYWYEGTYEFAQNYYLLAARQYNTIGDSVGLSQVYNNIGEVNKRLGEYKVARDYLIRSMELKKQDSTRAITLYNLGELYIATKEYDKATTYIRESLTLAKERNDERVMAYDYWSIARIKADQGFDEEAFSNFKLAENLWIKLGETRSLIQTYQDVAYAYRIRGEFIKAEDYLKKASELASDIDVPDLRITTYLEQSKLDSAKGNYERALYYLSRHNTLKDSVYNLLKIEQIARVQAIYETEMHERENRELRVERELKESQLRSQKLLLVAGAAGLLVAGGLVSMLIFQRRKILKANQDLKGKNEEINVQKTAIEGQAAALLKLNEALQDLNRSLEGRIDERSRQLIMQNQKLAEYTFINAHKLRAPVASVLGLIQLIEHAESHERDTIVAHLKTCANQLDQIIREISHDLEGAMVSEKK